MPDNQMANKDIHEICSEIGKVQAFGLECRLLDEDHLPLLCSWRNHSDVLPFMNDTRKVSPDILRFWFRRISKGSTAIYHVVFRQNQPVGFTGLNYIDWINRTYEEETFLNPEYIGHKLGLHIYLCRELIVKKLGLETAFVSIRIGNGRAISLVNKLAYELLNTNNGFHMYRSECGTRRKALKTIARAQGMEDEFILHFGDELDRHILQASSISGMKQAISADKPDMISD